MRWARLDGTADIGAWEIHESNCHLYQGRITCPDAVCQVGHRWRKRSTDGKTPTFYGNHLDGCDYKTESDEQIAERELEEVHAVINTCEEMQIRLEPPNCGRTKTIDTPGAIGGTGKRISIAETIGPCGQDRPGCGRYYGNSSGPRSSVSIGCR